MTQEFADHNKSQNSFLSRLERWFNAMCNGDWEHTYGITLETVDNPGWMLTVELRDTPLMEKPFIERVERLGASDWIHCTVSEGVFRGSGGPGRLEDLLSIFLDWAESDT